MTAHQGDLPSWTRRDFVRAGLATGGAVALDACASARGSADVIFSAESGR